MNLEIQTAQAVVKMAKETLKQVGETMFPGISDSYNHNKPKFSSLPISKLGNEIVTDLPLQICLFFNLCYFPFWLIISIIIAYVKVLYDIKNCTAVINISNFPAKIEMLFLKCYWIMHDLMNSNLYYYRNR